MANHVNSNIEFSNISEEASKFLLSLPTDNEEILVKIFPDYKSEGEWYIENIGSKWITFDDIYDVTLNITTAWDSPYLFYRNLYDKLHSLGSPDLEMWVQYDDEMPNFVGIFGRINDYVYEDCIHGENYIDVFGIVPYNEKKEEFEEEWWDRVHEFYADEYSAFKECYEQTKEIEETP
jgi:hypothetical protein|tara:strand:- start:118 stop:651 length:534 start_codon:yes stop_codon:yes gene_type:complete